jgi:hypothetical protein
MSGLVGTGGGSRSPTIRISYSLTGIHHLFARDREPEVGKSGVQKRMRLPRSGRFAAMLMLVATSAVACAPASHGRPPGAIQHITDGIALAATPWSISTTAPAGGVVSITLGPFYNVYTTEGIQIVSVTPIGGDGGLTVVGVDIAGPQRDAGLVDADYPAFPPADPGFGPLTPAVGFVIPADESPIDLGYDLIIGLKSSGNPRSLISGFRIVYQTGTTQQVYNEPAYIAVCAPQTDPENCRNNGV